MILKIWDGINKMNVEESTTLFHVFHLFLTGHLILLFLFYFILFFEFGSPVLPLKSV